MTRRESKGRGEKGSGKAVGASEREVVVEAMSRGLCKAQLTCTHTHTHTHTHKHTQTHTHTNTHKHTQTPDTHTHRQTERQTHTHTHTQTQGQFENGQYCGDGTLTFSDGSMCQARFLNDK